MGVEEKIRDMYASCTLFTKTAYKEKLFIEERVEIKIIQADKKVSVHLMITIQKVTSNV
jgi:hypothetical protein